MSFAIQRLNEGIRATLVAHFLALPVKDRCLRFGTALAPAVIAAYVDGIDFVRGAVFGVHDDRLALVGVAHMAIEDDLAEVALSVLPMHRGRGLGSALFKRAVAHARKRCIPRLFMLFRSRTMICLPSCAWGSPTYTNRCWGSAESASVSPSGDHQGWRLSPG